MQSKPHHAATERSKVRWQRTGALPSAVRVLCACRCTALTAGSHPAHRHHHQLSCAPVHGRCAPSAGLMQGALTGGVWGAFVALQARAQRPEPRALRQVVRIGGGYALGIGSLLAIYNGASCATQQLRSSMTSSSRRRAVTSGHHQESTVDSIVGGFVAGFVVSIPMHYTAGPTAAAASPAAVAAAAASPAAVAAAAAPSGVSAASAPSAVPRLSSLLRRVHWGGCGRYGAGMALVGVLMHAIAQPEGPALEQPRSAGTAMHHSTRSSF